MKSSIIVISSMESNTYFFSKDHCQNHNLGEGFIPCTHTIPVHVTPRKSVPDGIVKNVKDLVAVFYDDMEEIPNPNPEMQPVFEVESICFHPTQSRVRTHRGYHCGDCGKRF